MKFEEKFTSETITKGIKMTTITKTHKKAENYKNLCIFAYDALKFENGAKIFGKWKKLESFHETKTNFKGILYTNGSEYVICYLGTDRKSLKDHIGNLVMGIFGKNLQMRIANYFYKKCKEKFDFYNENLTLIGHSEGATEATFTGIKNNLKVVTFNAFGINPKLYDPKKDYSNLITNYRDESDLVSKLRENPGKTYIVPSIVSQNILKKHFGSIKSHKIANLGNCESAIPLEEYITNHPLFINYYGFFTK